jgi:hypothetical protein
VLGDVEPACAALLARGAGVQPDALDGLEQPRPLLLDEDRAEQAAEQADVAAYRPCAVVVRVYSSMPRCESREAASASTSCTEAR